MLARLQTQYPAVTFDTNLPGEAWVRGDATLAHAIEECLENAIMHFDRDLTDLQITVAVEQSLATVTRTIQDNGPGIPPTDLRAIRTGNETDLQHAIGIGLWVMKWVCRLHASGMEILPHEDGGTIVEMEFEAITPIDRLSSGGTITSVFHPDHTAIES